MTPEERVQHQMLSKEKLVPFLPTEERDPQAHKTGRAKQWLQEHYSSFLTQINVGSNYRSV